MGLIRNEFPLESLTPIPWKRKNRKVRRGLTVLPTQIFPNTDLGSLNGVFLPLHFYVKSIFVDFRRTKTAILKIFGPLNFNFWKNSTIENVKNSQIFKIQSCSKVKMSVFGSSKWPKLISRKIWVTEKSWNFHIEYSQLGCPGV